MFPKRDRNMNPARPARAPDRVKARNTSRLTGMPTRLAPSGFDPIANRSAPERQVAEPELEHDRDGERDHHQRPDVERADREQVDPRQVDDPVGSESVVTVLAPDSSTSSTRKIASVPSVVTIAGTRPHETMTPLIDAEDAAEDEAQPDHEQRRQVLEVAEQGAHAIGDEAHDRTHRQVDVAGQDDERLARPRGPRRSRSWR